MGASFIVEFKKLYKRPVTWVVGLIFLALIVLFSYVLPYVVINSLQGRANIPQQFPSNLLPENFVVTVLGQFGGGFGSALVLILGVLSVGSEYNWQTFKLALTQRPGRLQFLGGKLLAVGAVLAILTVLAFVVGAITSYIISALHGSSSGWPALGEILKGLGAGWLILVTFASLGFFLATLFRGSALAIGLGLVYTLVLESLFLRIASFQSETVAKISKALPVRNATDLASHFGSSQQAAQISNLPAGLKPIAPSHAALVLVAYVVVFLAISLLLFRWRDVT